MRRLPPEAAARYKQDGYCVGAGCVEHQHIDAYLRDLTLVVAAQLDSRGLPSLCDGLDLDTLYEQLAVLHGHDQAAYVATLRVFNKLESLYELFLADGIAHACSELGVVLPLMHTLPLFHIMIIVCAWMRVTTDSRRTGFPDAAQMQKLLIPYDRRSSHRVVAKVVVRVFRVW